jgi:hypothetical protein
MIESPIKLRLEREFFHMKRRIYEKSTADIIVSNERLNFFPFISREKNKDAHFQGYIGIFSQKKANE